MDLPGGKYVSGSELKMEKTKTISTLLESIKFGTIKITEYDWYEVHISATLLLENRTPKEALEQFWELIEKECSKNYVMICAMHYDCLYNYRKTLELCNCDLYNHDFYGELSSRDGDLLYEYEWYIEDNTVKISATLCERLGRI